MSLTGGGVPLPDSGVAELLGERLTVISDDSRVTASSTVEITGLDGEIGSQLVAFEGAFLDASAQLRESCGAYRSESASSFVSVGRGGVRQGRRCRWPAPTRG